MSRRTHYNPARDAARIAAEARANAMADVRAACERVAAAELAATRKAQAEARNVYRDGASAVYKWDGGKCAPATEQAAYVDASRKWGAHKAAKTRAVSHYAKKYGVDDAAVRVRLAGMMDKLRANGVGDKPETLAPAQYVVIPPPKPRELTEFTPPVRPTAYKPVMGSNPDFIRLMAYPLKLQG